MSRTVFKILINDIIYPYSVSPGNELVIGFHLPFKGHKFYIKIGNFFENTYYIVELCWKKPENSAAHRCDDLKFNFFFAQMFCFSKMHFFLLLLSNFQLYIPPQESQVEYQNQPWKHRKHEKKHFVKYKKSNCNNNNTNNTYRQRDTLVIFSLQTTLMNWKDFALYLNKLT